MESVEPNRLGGLRELFPSFYRPTEADQRLVITDGLVSVDTNVLLDLYRYTPPARGELLAVLALLGDRLFIPFTVGREYQAGRVGAVSDHLSEYDEASARLRAAREQAVSTFNALDKRRSYARGEFTTELDQLNSAFQAALNRVQTVATDYDLDPSQIATHDPIREQLEAISLGRVGRPLSDAEANEVQRIFAASDRGIVPGDSDAKRKPLNLAVGDFMLWNELKAEARHRQLPVLFVSSDDKKDWVLKQGGQTERPRRELVEEMRRDAGVGLQMMPTANFLILAREHLHATVSQETVEEVSRSRGRSRKSRSVRAPLIIRGEVPNREDGRQPGISIARCCAPVPGDEIVGRFLRGQSIAVHRTNCYNLGDLSSLPEGRVVEVDWEESPAAPLDILVQLLVNDEAAFYPAWPGSLRQLDAKVRSLHTSPHGEDGSVMIRARLGLASTSPVAEVLKVLESIPGVVHVGRYQEGPVDQTVISGQLDEIDDSASPGNVDEVDAAPATGP